MLENIQERLLEYKEQQNITYDELGKLIGVTKSVAYDICNKRRRFIDLEVIGKIVKLMGE